MGYERPNSGPKKKKCIALKKIKIQASEATKNLY